MGTPEGRGPQHSGTRVGAGGTMEAWREGPEWSPLGGQEEQLLELLAPGGVEPDIKTVHP